MGHKVRVDDCKSEINDSKANGDGNGYGYMV